MFNIKDRLTVITGHRATVCVITGIAHMKVGRVYTLKRLQDAGAAPAGFPYASLRWTYTRKGDYTRILESFLVGRKIA